MKAKNCILTGIADEAAHGIGAQIEIHRELGWRAIELRLIDGRNVAADLPAAGFAKVADALDEAKMAVTSLASQIGNWSRHINGDFSVDVAELRTAIPRMQRLGAKFIRTMSWLGEGVEESAWRSESVRRYRELAKMAADGGVMLLHENCTGWGGLSGSNMRELVAEVGSQHLGILFDIGNTISHGQEPWEFYAALRGSIDYVHVKDAHRALVGKDRANFCYPGEGDAQLRRILTDLCNGGFAGVIAIEPHVASIVHLKGHQPDPNQMRESYLRYAREFVSLVEEIQSNTQP